jgi:hypothetical protein
MKEIPLTRGKVALVDDEDFDYLNQWKWHCTAFGYAARFDYSLGRKHPILILMHRLINRTPAKMATDHINQNKLDNRRANLRICTDAENHRNSGMRKDNKSGYKGVYRARGWKKWQAYITLNKHRLHLGYFINVEDAARAYDQKAKELFGIFAKLNF